MTVHGLTFYSCSKHVTGRRYLITFGVSLFLGQDIIILNYLIVSGQHWYCAWGVQEQPGSEGKK